MVVGSGNVGILIDHALEDHGVVGGKHVLHGRTQGFNFLLHVAVALIGVRHLHLRGNGLQMQFLEVLPYALIKRGGKFRNLSHVHAPLLLMLCAPRFQPTFPAAFPTAAQAPIRRAETSLINGFWPVGRRAASSPVLHRNFRPCSRSPNLRRNRRPRSPRLPAPPDRAFPYLPSPVLPAGAGSR